MKKSVLTYAPVPYGPLESIEKLLNIRGFRVVRATTKSEALFRLANEIFSVVVCIDSADGSVQAELASELFSLPIGAITPVVVLGKGTQPTERTLLTSLLDQYFPADTDGETLADFIAETHSLRSAKAKRGNLSLSSVPFLLQQAAQFRLSGAVVIERAEEKCIIYMEEGFIVFASSNRDENRFGEFLVQQRIISRDQFLHSARLMQAGGKRLGRVLVDEGILKPQVLHTLIQSQVKHIIFNVFDWPDGEYYILFDERSGQDEAVAHFEVAPLILEGVNFKFSQARLEKEYSPFDWRVSLALPLTECLRRMHLKKNEADFLRLVGTGRPMDELLALNSFSRLESLKLLFGFRILGFLSFERERMHRPTADTIQKERAEALKELFTQKSSGPHQVPAVAAAQGWRRLLRVDYMIGAGALSVVITLLALFDVRTSRTGLSEDREPSNPVAVISATASPTSTPPIVTTVVEVVTATPTPITEPTRDLKGEEFAAALAEAESLRNNGRLVSAVEAYRKAVRLRPTDTRAILGLADSLFDVNRSNEAKGSYEKVIRMDPRNPRPYLALGTIYLMEDREALAKKAYEKYLERVVVTEENRQRVTEVRRILNNLNAKR